MIYDIYNISFEQATKYWSHYPYTFKIYQSECIDDSCNFGAEKINGCTAEQRWNAHIKRLGNYAHTDPFTMATAMLEMDKGKTKIDTGNGTTYNLSQMKSKVVLRCSPITADTGDSKYT